MKSKLLSMDPIVAWARITANVAEIHELLHESSVASTELECSDLFFSNDPIIQRVARLADQLRSVFAREETEGFVADLYETAPHCSDALAQLKLERSHLLLALDEIRELAGPYPSPQSTCDTIRERFDQFVADLARHEQSEDMLIQRAAFDQSGAIAEG